MTERWWFRPENPINNWRDVGRDKFDRGFSAEIENNAVSFLRKGWFSMNTTGANQRTLL